MQPNNETPAENPAEAAAADTAPTLAPEELHAHIDQAAFQCFAAVGQEFGLSTASAMLLVFDSMLAHLAAGGVQRRKLLAELLRVTARRAGVSTTAAPDGLRRLQADHARANAELLAEIERELATARAAAAPQ